MAVPVVIDICVTIFFTLRTKFFICPRARLPAPVVYYRSDPLVQPAFNSVTGSGDRVVPGTPVRTGIRLFCNGSIKKRPTVWGYNEYFFLIRSK